MSSLARTLEVLDLFSTETTAITAESVIERLQLSRTTAYRYLQVLTQSGLIAHFGGSYVPGPRIIELDLLIRTADPVLMVAEPVMREISADHECDVQLLSMYGNRVIVTSHVRAGGELPMSYGRGRTMPLFHGAGAWVIMAVLPAARQRRLLQMESNRPGGKTATWEDIRSTLGQTRRRGFYVSHGELDPDVVGIAAPITHDSLDAPAALVILLRRQRFALTDESRVIDLVRQAADLIRGRLDAPPQASHV